MNRKLFALPIVAVAFAAGPAMAQMSSETPFPSRNMPGTGTEQRDNNVWEGAVNSSRPVLPGGELYTGRSAVAGPPPLAEEALDASPGDHETGIGIGVDADDEGIGARAGIDIE